MPRVLNSTIEFQGRGLFTDRPCTLRLEPAPIDAALAHDTESHSIEGALGLWLATRDNTPVPVIDASIDPHPIHTVFANTPARSTNLRLPDGTRVATLEHVLSALVGCRVVGATIRLLPQDSSNDPNAPIEAPIFDGSARTVTDAIRASATHTLDDPPEPITPTETLVIRSTAGDPDAPAVGPSIRIEPPSPDQPHAIYRYKLRYPNQAALHSSLHAGTAAWYGEPATYATEVAPARTYATQAEANALKVAGLGAHLTTGDALVIGADGPIDNELRFPDEPARHKLLDLIGDLALAGRPIRATITADRAGHALNHKAAMALRELGSA